MALLLRLATLLLALCTVPSSANQTDWWFDVEIIVFARDVNAAALEERLPQHGLKTLSYPLQDPIGTRIFPSTRWLLQAWPTCAYPSEQDDLDPHYAWTSFLPQWLSSHCNLSSVLPHAVEGIDDTPPRREQVGVVIEGFDWQIPPNTHLLPSSALELTEVSQRIRSTRGLTRLLHVAWRQPVLFGRDSALPVRVFAGRNLAPPPSPFMPASLHMTETVAEEATLDVTMDTLLARLQQPQPVSFAQLLEVNQRQSATASVKNSISELPKDIWQLDGSLRVYLRYINKVPYLHVEQNLEYREANSENDIAVFPLEETRRLISTQLHYFDHPLFGVVMQLRRFHPPAAGQQ